MVPLVWRLRGTAAAGVPARFELGAPGGARGWPGAPAFSRRAVNPRSFALECEFGNAATLSRRGEPAICIMSPENGPEARSVPLVQAGVGPGVVRGNAPLEIRFRPRKGPRPAPCPGPDLPGGGGIPGGAPALRQISIDCADGSLLAHAVGEPGIEGTGTPSRTAASDCSRRRNGGSRPFPTRPLSHPVRPATAPQPGSGPLELLARGGRPVPAAAASQPPRPSGSCAPGGSRTRVPGPGPLFQCHVDGKVPRVWAAYLALGGHDGPPGGSRR